jgi:hypothetical protein
VRQTPAPAPVTVAKRVWPEGSAVYVEHGAGKLEKQIGWIVRKGPVYEAHRRTGPRDFDTQLMGDAPDFGQALTKLGGKAWAKP